MLARETKYKNKNMSAHFADNFWGEGDQGVVALEKRMKVAKHTCVALLNVFKAK